LDAHANAGLTLGHDGTAYVGTGSELLALDPSGDLRWAVPAQGGVQSAPAIASDGTIYFTAVAGPDGSSLTAVSSSGTVLWAGPARATAPRRPLGGMPTPRMGSSCGTGGRSTGCCSPHHPSRKMEPSISGTAGVGSTHCIQTVRSVGSGTSATTSPDPRPSPK